MELHWEMKWKGLGRRTKQQEEYRVIFHQCQAPLFTRHNFFVCILYPDTHGLCETYKSHLQKNIIRLSAS